MAAAPPPTATRYYAASAIAARGAAQAVSEARPRGIRAAWLALARFQVAQATLAPRAADRMLADQDIDVEPIATLDPAGFTTPLDSFDRMLAAIERDIAAQVVEQAEQITRDADARYARLVESLVQDAGRAAQSVDIAVRPTVQFVRHLNLPSCSRCAVLAGRVYRYSEGFPRHTGCDCVMIPVTVASPDLTYDPEALARSGQVTGLSKADLRAVVEGADFGKVVNVRSRKAGLTTAGEVLARGGRPTPAGIYRRANSREDAVALLKQYGYLR